MATRKKSANAGAQSAAATTQPQLTEAELLEHLKDELDDVVQAAKDLGDGISTHEVIHLVGQAVEGVERLSNAPEEGARKKAVVVAFLQWLDDLVPIRATLAKVLPFPASLNAFEAILIESAIAFATETMVGWFNATIWKR